MNSTVSAMIPSRFKRIGLTIALPLAILALAACASAAEPEATSAPSATAVPAATAVASEPAPAATEAPAAAAMLAPTFELPNAMGETVSLASYAGDKNVVLVFYRGFW